MCTCLPGLFAVQVVQVLIDEHGGCEEGELPGGGGMTEGGLSVEDDHKVGEED
jgi:hypothetical protein